MNVYIFPTLPYPTEGYSIAVCSDLKRLDIKNDDLVLWYNLSCLEKEVDFGSIISGTAKISRKRLLNLLRLNPSTELTLSDVKGVQFPKHPDCVFCGDTIIYRLLRLIYPTDKIVVRFHNCFLRIANRVDILGNSNTSMKFRMTLFLFSRLEKTIFNDDKCEKIFISEEDRSFYSMITGRFSDSAVWKVVPNMELVNKNRFVVEKPTKIIWFGGIHAHKTDSVRWFITDVFYKLRQKYPHLEFHLYGNNTMAFDNPKNNIYAHGRYQGTSLPNKADSIYINPDVSGGGVKVKLIQYFEEGVTFVTSPFGMEGYSSELFDNKCRYCVQLDEWYKLLCGLFVHSFN